MSRTAKTLPVRPRRKAGQVGARRRKTTPATPLRSTPKQRGGCTGHGAAGQFHGSVRYGLVGFRMMGNAFGLTPAATAQVLGGLRVQSLAKFERDGLLRPRRTPAGSRIFDAFDVELARDVLTESPIFRKCDRHLTEHAEYLNDLARRWRTGELPTRTKSALMQYMHRLRLDASPALRARIDETLAHEAVCCGRVAGADFRGGPLVPCCKLCASSPTYYRRSEQVGTSAMRRASA